MAADGAMGSGLGLDRGGGSRADPARVDAIHDGLDLADERLSTGFGEDARRGLSDALSRLAAAAQAADLEQSAAAVRRLRDRIARADPAMLKSRGGLGGLFDGSGKRLAGFREAFADVVRDLTDADRDLRDRRPALERRSAALDALHAEITGLVAEIDAFIAAGLRRLKGLPPDDAQREAADRFAARIAQLGALREAAVARLPLIRVCQNAEAGGPGLNDRACAALAEWRDQWTGLLGMDRKRPRRIRPDAPALDKARGALLDVLNAVENALETAGRRRAGAAERIAALSTSRDV